MDNQFNLLWERLSRLVATLSKSDNLSDQRFLLASFNVDLMPVKRNREIFAVDYCFVDPKSSSQNECYKADATAPRIVDLFPSASAINIVDNKYKDRSAAVEFIASLFSVDITASTTIPTSPLLVRKAVSFQKPYRSMWSLSAGYLSTV